MSLLLSAFSWIKLYNFKLVLQMSFNAFLQIYSCWLTYTNEKTCKLTKIQPETLAQASRISGVNPADLAILAVYIEQGKIAKVDWCADIWKTAGRSGLRFFWWFWNFWTIFYKMQSLMQALCLLCVEG